MGTGRLTLAAADRALLKAAMSDKRTPKQLSEALDGWLTPEQAALRLKELLSGDLLSDLEEQRLVLLDARIHLERLDEMIESGNLKALPEYAKLLRFIAERLDKASLNVDQIDTRIHEDHGKYWFMSLMAAYQVMAQQMSELGVEIGNEQKYEIIQISSDAGMAELEQHIAE